MGNVPRKVTIQLRKTNIREFTAGVRFNGVWVLGIGPQKRSAIKGLHSKLAELKAPPAEFTVNELPAAKPAEKPEQPVTKPEAPAAKPETTKTEPKFTSPEALEVATEDLVDDVAEDVPAAEPGSQWVTPWSDKAAYLKETVAAINATLATGIPRTREAKAEFRKNVCLFMENKEDGAKFLGCYRRLPSGEMILTKFYPDFEDPTVRRPKAGDGAKRLHKDINGNWVNNEGESLQLQDKPARTEKKYWYPGGRFAYVSADSQGKAWKAAAEKRGMTAEQSELMYKLGFVVSLRAHHKDPHTPFEADLASAGYTETKISAIVAEVKDRAAKAA